MAIVVYPVDAVTGAPSYTGRLARQTLAPLLAGATAARPLGARSGVRPGTSVTTVTATSTTWTMDLHAGILDLETSGLVGPYAYAVNTAQTGAVTAADATRPRIDLVWVRLDDPAESDGSSVPAVVAGYTAGAPLAVPVAPATPARCMVLATIQVPLSGGGSPTVIWVAPYTVAAGAPTPVYSPADRDAKFPVPYDGLAVYRLDAHCVERFDGTRWHPSVAPIIATDAGIVTSGTANVFTTALRTITDPFGTGVPYMCRTTYYLGLITAAAGVNARAWINVNGAGFRWALISPLSSVAVSAVTVMSTGGTVTFQGVLTNLSATVATVSDAGSHIMVTEVTPL